MPHRRRNAIALVLACVLISATACAPHETVKRRGRHTKIGYTSLVRDPASGRIVVLVDMWRYDIKGGVTDSETWMFAADMASHESRFVGSFVGPAAPAELPTYRGIRTQVLGWHQGEMVLAFCALKDMGSADEIRGAPFGFGLATQSATCRTIAAPPDGMVPLTTTFHWSNLSVDQLEKGTAYSRSIDEDLVSFGGGHLLADAAGTASLCLSSRRQGAEGGLVRFCRDAEDYADRIVTSQRRCEDPLPVDLSCEGEFGPWYATIRGQRHKLDGGAMQKPLEEALREAGTRSVLLRGPRLAQGMTVGRAAFWAKEAGANCVNFEATD